MSIESATDEAVFQAFEANVLVLTLRQGDIVVLDTSGRTRMPPRKPQSALPTRRSNISRPITPDRNPIEKMWSKIKALLRAARARTSRALNTAIRKAFSSVTADDSLSWFVSCGYGFN